jgi:hypothetical protein
MCDPLASPLDLTDVPAPEWSVFKFGWQEQQVCNYGQPTRQGVYLRSAADKTRCVLMIIWQESVCVDDRWQDRSEIRISWRNKVYARDHLRGEDIDIERSQGLYYK